jgi:hypothetical protein
MLDHRGLTDFPDAVASDRVTLRAASIKRLAAGLRVRFLSVTIAMGRGLAGKSTGKGLMSPRRVPKRRMDSGSIVTWRPVGKSPLAMCTDVETRPVRIIISTPAGNGPDVIGRIVADHLTRLWGQQVVILNQPGANGAIAMRAAATSAPDGYTLSSRYSQTTSRCRNGSCRSTLRAISSLSDS